MELSEILTRQLVDIQTDQKQCVVESSEEESIEENKIVPEKGGVMDKLSSTTSGDGVGKLTDNSRKKNKGGILDKLKSNTTGAGVGSLSAAGAGYDGLRFSKRGK